MKPRANIFLIVQVERCELNFTSNFMVRFVWKLPKRKLCNRRMQKKVEIQKKKLVTSCVHLACKGKGRILVYAVCDLTSHGKGVRPGTDLYIQTEPKPDHCESHLLQNKSLIRGDWVGTQRDPLNRPTGCDCRENLDPYWDFRYWPHTCRQPQKCLSNALETQWGLDAGRTSVWGRLTHLIADLSHIYLQICLQWITCPHFPPWKGNHICLWLHPWDFLIFSVPAEGPFSFPLSYSLALPHAVFPSCSLSWHPLVFPNSSLSHIFQIQSRCHCPFLIFSMFLPHLAFPSAVFCTRFYIFLATTAGKQWWLPLPMVTICPFLWASMTKIQAVRRNNTRYIQFAWIT